MRDVRFRLGDWLINPADNSLENQNIRRQVEPHVMEVLEFLCQHPGETVSAEQLLEACWPDSDFGDNPVHKAIARLRKALNDSSTQPQYLQTIRKRGYRIIAPVTHLDEGRLNQTSVNWPHGSPYIGLTPFDAEHSGVFFGRDHAIKQIGEQIRQQIQYGIGFIMLLGPSGSGKTSLLKAGVLPQLLASSSHHHIHIPCAAWLELNDQTTTNWLPQLVHSLGQWTISQQPVFAATEQAFFIQQAEQGYCLALVERIADRLARYRQSKRISTEHPVRFVLVIDAFEKICTNNGQLTRQTTAFLQAVETLATSDQVLVMVTARNDFYQHISQLPLVNRLKHGLGQYDVAPPTPGELGEMIRCPAQAAGIVFEQQATTRVRLDDQIRDDIIDQPDALPLLQYALSELYRLRDERQQLTFAAYHGIGGVQGALSRSVEAVVAALPSPVQQCLPALLSRMIRQQADGNVTGIAFAWHQVNDEHEQCLIERLIEARLLVAEFHDGQRRIRAAHESLFMHWPRAQQWIDDHRAALLLHDSLSISARRWLNENRNRDFLLAPGKPLADARWLADNHSLLLGDNEAEYLQQSLRRARTRSMIKRTAIVALIVLSMSTGIAGLVAVNARNMAEQRQHEAEKLISFMLGDLTERLRPLGQLSLLDQVGDAAMTYLSSEAGLTQQPSLQLLRATALTQIAEVRQSQGDNEAAVATLLQARHELHNSLRQDDYAAALRQAGLIEYWLGYIAFLRQQETSAADHWQTYHRYTRQWLQLEPANPEAQIELSYALNNLGTLANQRRELQTAFQYFKESSELKARVLATQPNNSQLTTELADSYSWTARNARDAGLLAQAHHYHLLENTLLQQLLSDDRENYSLLYRAAAASQNLGQIEILLGRTSSAAEHLTEALQQTQLLLEVDPSNIHWRTLNAYVNGHLGWALHGLECHQQARESLKQASQTLEQLLTGDPLNHQWRLSLATTRYRLALTMHALDQHQQAQQQLDQAKALTTTMIENGGSDQATAILHSNIEITQGEWNCPTAPDQAHHIWTTAMTWLIALPDQNDLNLNAALLRVQLNLQLDATHPLEHLRAAAYQPAALQAYFTDNTRKQPCPLLSKKSL
ncbi:MAG: winged helix-turn-helix domain-containing protein [Wenzhouxiangellaceae bacterium]